MTSPLFSSMTLPLGEHHSTRVDPDVYLRLRHRRWYRNSQGYAVCFDGSPIVYLHREITGAAPGQFVDHLNGDKLDNRRANLELVTRTQNNRRRHVATNPTGYKGVYQRGETRFAARIHCQGRQYYLGMYPTAETAALAYNHAAGQLFGDDAVLNPVGGQLPAPDVEYVEDKLAGRPRAPRYRGRKTVPKRPSPFQGVYWERGRWRAKIGHRGRKVHLGYFDDEIEAAQAYDAAARRLHGDRARLNFPWGGRPRS